MLLVFVAITALFALGAAMTYRERGWGWVSITLACATVVLGLGSILESLVLRIELTDDAMLVRTSPAADVIRKRTSIASGRRRELRPPFYLRTVVG